MRRSPNVLYVGDHYQGGVVVQVYPVLVSRRLLGAPVLGFVDWPGAVL